MLSCACCLEITGCWKLVSNTVMCLCFHLRPHQVRLHGKSKPIPTYLRWEVIPGVKHAGFTANSWPCAYPTVTHSHSSPVLVSLCWNVQHWNMSCCTCCWQARIVLNGWHSKVNMHDLAKMKTHRSSIPTGRGLRSTEPAPNKGPVHDEGVRQKSQSHTQQNQQ